ncbi:LacI family DNA-binding transcriptional regulator [Rhodoferax sp. GW822-FHT02A01]|jgi:LacI family transcriptional regulator|uniref:LacI family DNA-binding transcriptional regulator n=1 Tax=Rhodoferax sp. GW822-FHT02A01 TaxID=3141537 RepID=UPI00315C8E58
MATTVTIAEIAKSAGVGTATVDRVLNGRSGVNAETERKVLDAINALGAPTVTRGRPRSKGNFKFAYVLPEASTPFLDDLERHIAQTAGDFRHQHITELTYRFPAEDPARFAQELSRVTDCDAIVLVGPDVPAVKLAINDHVRAGVHVATLFTDVAGSMRQAFVGADNRAAGRTAGLLLARMASQPQRNRLLLLSQTTRMSAEIERRIGFVQVIEERFPALVVERLPDIPADDDEACKALSDYFNSGVDLSHISGVYCVGVATAGIARALAQAGLTQDVALVAHDLTAAHQSMLIQGSLAYVLHQDVHYCVLTAARVLRGLCENVRGVQSVVQPRVEILTAENLH